MGGSTRGLSGLNISGWGSKHMWVGSIKTDGVGSIKIKTGVRLNKKKG